MKNDEGWRMNDEGWWFQDVEGFCFQTNRLMDICECRVTFATEKYMSKKALAELKVISCCAFCYTLSGTNVKDC